MRQLFFVWLAVFLSGCGMATKEAQPLSSFSDEVRVSAPVFENGKVLLPVTAELKKADSVRVCWLSEAEVSNNHIYVTISQAAATPDYLSFTNTGNNTATCPPAQLHHVTRGRFMVFYRDPDKKLTHIGSVTVDQPLVQRYLMSL